MLPETTLGNNVMRVTIYTDGSARDMQTDRGTEYHAGWGLWGYKEDDQSCDFSAYGPIGRDGTNNQAEIKGAVRAIEIATALKATELTIHMDSMYVKDSCQKYISNWMRNGWKRADGEPVKNQDYWKTFIQADNKASKEGLNIIYKWVKGHSDDKGNDLADDFALMGTKASASLITSDVLNLDNMGKKAPTKEEKEEVKKEKPKKVKVPVRNALIVSGAKLMTLTNAPSFTTKLETGDETYNVFYGTKYGNDAKTLDRELGVESADTMQCIVLSKESDFQMDSLKSRIDEISNDGTVYPVITYFDKLASTNVRKRMFEGELDIKRRGEYLYYMGEKKDATTGLMMPIEILLARVLKIARRAWDAMTHLDTKYAVLTEYLSGNIKDEDVIDITDRLVIEEENAKGKIKRLPNPDTKGSKSLDVDLWYGTSIKIASNTETINLQSIGTILKQFPDVKFYLIKHMENSVMYRYSFMAIAENGSMIMDNPYINVIYKSNKK